MNPHTTHNIESKISDLYATECWLLTLEEAFAASDSTNPHYLSWLHFIDSSRSRREMLRFMAKLENCRISFDWIVPKSVFTYDYKCLASELTGSPSSGAHSAKALDQLTRYLILEYLELLRMADQNQIWSIVMAVESILETMPRSHQRFLTENLARSA